MRCHLIEMRATYQSIRGILLRSDIKVPINWPSCTVGDAVEQDLGVALLQDDGQPLEGVGGHFSPKVLQIYMLQIYVVDIYVDRNFSFCNQCTTACTRLEIIAPKILRRGRVSRNLKRLPTHWKQNKK